MLIKSVLTKPKKSLGQNFLIDKNILQKIVNSVSIYKNKEILEKGPGTGNLTHYLIKKNPKKFVKNHNIKKINNDRLICDFIAGMTDRYAINLYNSLK